MTREAFSLEWDESIEQFVGLHSDYYRQKFRNIFSSGQGRFRPNLAAVIVGPLWAAARGLYGLFIVGALAELAIIIGIVFLASGGTSVDRLARVQTLQVQGEARQAQADEERAKNNIANADQLQNLAQSLLQAAAREREIAEEVGRNARAMSLVAIGAWAAFRIVFGTIGDFIYAGQYMRWRRQRTTPSGFSWARIAAATALLSVIYFIFFAGGTVPQISSIISFQTGASDLAGATAGILDGFFVQLTQTGRPFFSAVTGSISSLVGAVESFLRTLPWICTAIVATFVAWQVAGRITAFFTAVGLVYLAVFGFWEKSMITIALLGTAAFLALCIGIPLGILCGKSEKAYSLFRPLLDLMQTMPAFIYLIPIIAFFGIGKTPGVLATIIFGMPPVARLTALGLQQIPTSIREASVAFGASPLQSLWKVELPLALPSIMAGINQTILMCLSMVVIASLIGAGGLGEDVLQALQWASVGQGFLVGTAVLICAIILDRLIQGKRSN